MDDRRHCRRCLSSSRRWPQVWRQLMWLRRHIRGSPRGLCQPDVPQGLGGGRSRSKRCARELGWSADWLLCCSGSAVAFGFGPMLLLAAHPSPMAFWRPRAVARCSSSLAGRGARLLAGSQARPLAGRRGLRARHGGGLPAAMPAAGTCGKGCLSKKCKHAQSSL